MPIETCADDTNSIQSIFCTASYFDIAQTAIAIIAVVIATYTVYNHAKYIKKSKTAEMLLSLNDNQRLFEGIDTIHKIHLSERDIDQLAERNFINSIEAQLIRYTLNHFERVAACVEENIYNERLIVKTQGSRIAKLYEITAPYIARIRLETNSQLAYRNFELLARRMKKLA